MVFALFTSVAAAKPGGRITKYEASQEKSSSGQRVMVLHIEAERLNAAAKQFVKLAIQVKDADDIVYFAKVTSQGGAAVFGGGPMVVTIWTFKIVLDNIKKPRLSYEVVLIDGATNETVDSRVRGIPKRDIWDKENEKAEKLDVKQFVGGSPFEAPSKIPGI